MNTEILNELALAAIISALIGAVLIDFRQHRIPNSLCLCLVLFGFIFQVSLSGWIGVAYWASGLVAGLILFLPFYILKGMGAGDVKMLAAIGSGLGPLNIIFAAGYTLIAGGVMGLFWWLGSRLRRLGDVGAAIAKLPYTTKQYFFSAWFYFRTGQRLSGPVQQTVNKHSGNRFPYALAIACGSMMVIYHLNAAEFFHLKALFNINWISGGAL